MGPGFKMPEAKAEGGRVGYRDGTKMMEPFDCRARKERRCARFILHTT